jgi:hypothetical protein
MLGVLDVFMKNSPLSFFYKYNMLLWCSEQVMIIAYRVQE